MGRSKNPGDREGTTGPTQTTKRRQKGKWTKPEGDLMLGRNTRRKSAFPWGAGWRDDRGNPGRGSRRISAEGLGGRGAGLPRRPWTVGESVGKPGNREDEAVGSDSFGRLGNWGRAGTGNKQRELVKGSFGFGFGFGFQTQQHKDYRLHYHWRVTITQHWSQVPDGLRTRRRGECSCSRLPLIVECRFARRHELDCGAGGVAARWLTTIKSVKLRDLRSLGYCQNLRD